MKKVKKKSNHILFLTSILIFIVGVGIFIYPFISNYLAEKNQREVIRAYDETVNQMDKDELEKQWQLARNYNDNLAGDPLHDPFILGSGYAIPDDYFQVLNINNDGVMGYIEIDKIDVYLPIYHGTSEETLEKGAGHLEGTSLPIGGSNRFSVISAHRGLPSAELFTRLDEMEIGDIFCIYVLDCKLTYQVDLIEVIEPENLSLIKGETDKDLVTLMTCTPYAVNTHRLLVRGKRIENIDNKEDKKSISQNQGIALWLKEYLFSIVLGIVLLILIICLCLKKYKKG